MGLQEVGFEGVDRIDVIVLHSSYRAKNRHDKFDTLKAEIQISSR